MIRMGDRGGGEGHDVSLQGFQNFIFQGARACHRPFPSLDSGSRCYIMRSSQHRDVAYHCSWKQRNSITGWQLNSLCRGCVLVAVDDASPRALSTSPPRPFISAVCLSVCQWCPEAMEDQQSPSNECTAAALGTMTNCGASALRDSSRENNGDESSLTKLLYTIVGKHRMRGARQIRSVTCNLGDESKNGGWSAYESEFYVCVLDQMFRKSRHLVMCKKLVNTVKQRWQGWSKAGYSCSSANKDQNHWNNM